MPECGILAKIRHFQWPKIRQTAPLAACSAQGACRRLQAPPRAADPRGKCGRRQKYVIKYVYIPPATLPVPGTSRYGEISPLFLCKNDSVHPPSPRATARTYRPSRERWQAAKVYHEPHSHTASHAPKACNVEIWRDLPPFSMKNRLQPPAVAESGRQVLQTPAGMVAGSKRIS